MKHIINKLYFNKYLMLAVSFFFCCGVTYLLPGSEDFRIYGDTVRLHVIADCDTVEAQKIKLEVRDEVVDTAKILLKSCKSKSEATFILKKNLPALEKSAAEVLEKNGVGYGARGSVSEEYYPTRDYGTFRLPCGKYTSLQIKLGEAEGENWWCLLYPALCLEPSGAKLPRIAQGEGNYKIKFKILETVFSWL